MIYCKYYLNSFIKVWCSFQVINVTHVRNLLLFFKSLAAITPGTINDFWEIPWRRDVTAEEIKEATSIRIVSYCGNEKVTGK